MRTWGGVRRSEIINNQILYHLSMGHVARADFTLTGILQAHCMQLVSFKNSQELHISIRAAMTSSVASAVYSLYSGYVSRVLILYPPLITINPL